MLARSMALALTMLGLPIIPIADAGGFGVNAGLTSSALAQDRSENEASRAVDRVSVAWPIWRHGSGLLYGSMTFKNANPFPVWNIIVACDFFDEWGNPIGTRATVIRRVLGPGRVRVGGIYFTAIRSNTVAGACRVLSATRYPRSSGPT